MPINPADVKQIFGTYVPIKPPLTLSLTIREIHEREKIQEGSFLLRVPRVCLAVGIHIVLESDRGSSFASFKRNCASSAEM
jgi:hypothetical protein